MFNQLLALSLLGVVLFGVVQAARLKRASYVAMALMGAALLVALITSHPVAYAAAVGMIVLRWYVVFREARGTLPALFSRSEPRRFASVGLLPEGATVEKPPPAAEEDAPKVLEGWVDLDFQTPAALVPCQGGGTLQVASGALRARIRFKHADRGEVDDVQVRLVLSDDQGQEWGLESYLVGSLFTDLFEEKEQREALEKSKAFMPWSAAPKAWHEALEKRCLLSGVLNLLDSRDSFTLRIGDEMHHLRIKYQGAKIDVAAIGSGLVVRVRGIVETLYKGEGEAREVDDYVELPPFAWLAPSALLLCFSEPGHHYRSLEDVEEMVEREDREPSKAKRLTSKGEPQVGVVLRPA